MTFLTMKHFLHVKVWSDISGIVKQLVCRTFYFNHCFKVRLQKVDLSSIWSTFIENTLHLVKSFTSFCYFYIWFILHVRGVTFCANCTLFIKLFFFLLYFQFVCFLKNKSWVIVITVTSVLLASLLLTAYKHVYKVIDHWVLNRRSPASACRCSCYIYKSNLSAMFCYVSFEFLHYLFHFLPFVFCFCIVLLFFRYFQILIVIVGDYDSHHLQYQFD